MRPPELRGDAPAQRPLGTRAPLLGWEPLLTLEEGWAAPTSWLEPQRLLVRLRRLRLRS